MSGALRVRGLRLSRGDRVILSGVDLSADTGEVVSEAAAQAAVQTPIALLGALLSMPGGGSSALSVARLLGRNFPLVLLLVMIGALFWPTEETGPAGADADAPRPNGGDDHMPSALRH